MLIEVLSVCRRPPAWVSDAREAYAKRLRGAITLEFRQIPPGPDAMPAAGRLEDEGRRLLKAVRAGTHVVALDIDGEAPDSEAVAVMLDGWRARFQRVALVIGGADGIAPAFLATAGQRWSLSRLTLPHLLVQILVAEQIYRAWTILERHPYHRA